MKELSLNILDIAENSVKAKATDITIKITEDDENFSFSILDNGVGMEEDFLESVTNPFTTTRTTRPVGLGIPLLKMAAEQTGGGVEIESKYYLDFPDNHGTLISATFFKKHIDFVPLGNIVETIVTLIQGNPQIDFVFTHKIGDKTVSLDTKELKSVLGDVPLNNTEVILWLKEFLEEQYNNCNLT